MRVTDVLKSTNKFGFVPSLALEGGNTAADLMMSGESSPERIAGVLKQTSPLRRKLANESLSLGRGPSVNDVEPNPVPSKITHVSFITSNFIKNLISHELAELKN